VANSVLRPSVRVPICFTACPVNHPLPFSPRSVGVSLREGGDELCSHAGRTDQAVRVFLASDVTCYYQASRAQPGTADEQSAVNSSRVRVALIADQEDYPEAQTMPVLRASSTLSVIPGTGYHTDRARR
jgi:hypothetical protein